MPNMKYHGFDIEVSEKFKQLILKDKLIPLAIEGEVDPIKFAIEIYLLNKLIETIPNGQHEFDRINKKEEVITSIVWEMYDLYQTNMANTKAVTFNSQNNQDDSSKQQEIIQFKANNYSTDTHGRIAFLIQEMQRAFVFTELGHQGIIQSYINKIKPFLPFTKDPLQILLENFLKDFPKRIEAAKKNKSGIEEAVNKEISENQEIQKEQWKALKTKIIQVEELGGAFHACEALVGDITFMKYVFSYAIYDLDLDVNKIEIFKERMLDRYARLIELIQLCKEKYRTNIEGSSGEIKGLKIILDDIFIKQLLMLKNSLMDNKDSGKRNDYEILGLKSDASLEELKKRYHYLALQLHPDKTKDQDKIKMFIEINESYRRLFEIMSQERKNEMSH